MAPRKKKPTPARKAARTPVINLKATEIKSTDVPAKSKAEDKSESKTQDKPTAKQASAKPSKPAPKNVAGEKPDNKKPETAKVAKNNKAKTGLIAVSLAALIAAGVGGAWAFKTYGGKFFANQDVASSRQLNELQARLEKLEASGSGAQKMTILVQELKGQVDSNKTMLATNQSSLAANSEKLRGIEKSVADIRVALASAAKEGTGPVAAANNLQFKAFGANIAELEKQLAGVNSSSIEDLSNLETRIEALLIRLNAVEEQQQKIAKNPNGNPAGELARAFTILRAKVASGEPFETALDNVAGKLPQETALDVLRPFAKSGAPMMEKLVSSLQSIVVKSAADETGNETKSENGLLGNITSKLTGLVKVTKVGKTDWQQTKDEAIKALQAGQVKVAIKTMNGVQEKPAELKVWFELAGNKLEIDNAVQQMSATIVSQLTTGNE